MINKILGMGNAVLDILSKTTDGYLLKNKLIKGSMSLVEQTESDNLLRKIKSLKKDSGGSVANTIVGISILGSTAYFCGKVKDDELGNEFAKNMEKTGVKFLCKKASSGLPTARCLVLVTSDGERTMQTFLGASTTLAKEDVEEKFFDNIQYLLVEGYLWSSKSAIGAIKKAVNISKKNKIKIVFSLSDPYLVKMYRKEILEFVLNHVDILIGNKNEYLEICSQNDEKTKKLLIESVESIIITAGKNGASVIEKNKNFKIEAEKVNEVLDTTGAGDMFAAGFLYKKIKGEPTHIAAKFGCKTAARIIQQYGARPSKDTFRDLL